MLDPLDTLLDTAAAELDTSLTLHANHSWPHRESTVLEAHDAAGTPWIVKQVRDPAAYEREVHALQTWAPHLGHDRAPRLRAAVPTHSLLVMNKLPGHAGTATTTPEFHQAGQLIRRLHDTEPSEPDPDYPARATHNVDHWLSRVPDVVTPTELAFVRSRITSLESLPPVLSGPIHNDNQPRNWLTDTTGTLRLIDFGKSKRDAQLRDFERLHNHDWLTRPDLREAFFSGYGRPLTATEYETLTCISAVAALTTILWAHTHAAPAFKTHGRQTLTRLRSTPH